MSVQVKSCYNILKQVIFGDSENNNVAQIRFAAPYVANIGDESSGCNKCQTVRGKRCIFPFFYGGRTYNKCSEAGNVCAIAVNGNGDYLRGDYCDMSSGCNISKCQTLDGKRCIFPFSYSGHTFNKCSEIGNQCATAVNGNGHFLRGGYCDMSLCN